MANVDALPEKTFIGSTIAYLQRVAGEAAMPAAYVLRRPLQMLQEATRIEPTRIDCCSQRKSGHAARYSFITKRLDRLCACHQHGVTGDGGECNDQRQRAGDDEGR